MLRPSKHAHPDRTVIAVAVLLLRRLRDRRLAEYMELLEVTKGNVKGGELLFLPALNLLFLLGLIAYHRKTDAIEYLGPA
jgi:hypothetical protein